MTMTGGPACPAPVSETTRVQLGHGSGGKLSAALLRDRFLPLLSNATLDRLGDAAVLPVAEGKLAFSTDTFVVRPLEFPGGDIGSLAIHGTVNDLAMMGAKPLWLSCGFVLEEGLEFQLLDRIIGSMADAANHAGVQLVTGDTKVVERGLADGCYINTAGLGLVDNDFQPNPAKARSGDLILVSGPIGRHGMAIMAAREELAFEADLTSDSAALHRLVAKMRQAVGSDAIHTLRDPTRGGVASALNEIAGQAGVGMLLQEGSLPLPGPVTAACEMLGLDPLYVANEGVFLAIIEQQAAQKALAALREDQLGAGAAIIGKVVTNHPGVVALETAIGGTRVVDLLPGDQLPRIC